MNQKKKWIPSKEELSRDLNYYLNNMTEAERKWFDYFCDKFGWPNPFNNEEESS